MRFAPILIGVSLVQAAFSAVAAIPDGKRAVSFGDSGISLRSVSIPLYVLCVNSLDGRNTHMAVFLDLEQFRPTWRRIQSRPA